MTHSTLDDVRSQIIASIDEVRAAGSVKRWRRRPIDLVYRDHRVALGIVDMLEAIARSLGETKVHVFAREATPGGTPIVLQPTNPNAARVEIFVNWLDDIVHLCPGEYGDIEMWPNRRESAEAFVSYIGRYVDAVISGGFRETFSGKPEPAPRATKLEFLIEGRWERRGDLLPPRRRFAWITRHYEPY
jgi:hypothetical protein